VGATALKNLDVDIKKVRLGVDRLVKSGPDKVKKKKLPQTPRAKRVMEYAIEEAKALSHNYVGTEHILLGLLRVREGIGAQVLVNLGLKLEDIRQEVLSLLQPGLKTDTSEERHFVRLVVGRNRMTFEGEEVTLDELPGLMEKVPNRHSTVFEIAITTKKIPFERYDGVKNQADKLVEQFGFEYLSYVGVHPLRSKGGPSETEKTSPVAKAGGIDLLQRYPTTLTEKSADPGKAREWKFSPEDIYSLSRFSFEVGDALGVKMGAANVGVGHCADGAVWAVVIPKEYGSLRSSAHSGPEKIKHLWLRFHPAEVTNLFGKETVIGSGDKSLQSLMQKVADIKMHSSWQAGGRAMIPGRKDFTVDADIEKGIRRFFVVDREADSVRYISAFENRIVPAGEIDKKRPVVVKTQPAAFANDVSPGLKIIKVMFDKAMLNRSWSWVGSGETYPETTGEPYYDSSKKTCNLPVKLEAGKVYWIGINSPRHKFFQTARHIPAVPYVILFATKDKDGNPTTIPEDMLAEAKVINEQAGKTDVQVEVGGTRQINSRPEVRESAVSANPAGLQQLIDFARRGSTVIVPRGVYTKPIEINKSLTLKGESRADCVFEVTDDKPAIFVDTKGKGKVTIEGITIKWQLATSDNMRTPFALYVRDTKAEVENCSFLPLGNFKRSVVAVRADGFSNLTISRCRFEGFEYVVGYGEGTEGTVSDNLIMDCGHQGITLYAGAKAQIIRNVITGSRYHAVRSTGGTLFMKDNLIINNANRGVYLGNKSARGTISNNVIMGNGTGISSFAESKVKIENNIIADSSYAGIGMRNSCSLLIRNNIFQGNERGWILFKEGGKGGNTAYRNTFWKNRIDAENFRKTANSVEAEPDFVDPDNGDFSLRRGLAKGYKQGLTKPQVLKTLWERWQNRADKNEPFGSAGQTNVQVEGKNISKEEITTVFLPFVEKEPLALDLATGELIKIICKGEIDFDNPDFIQALKELKKGDLILDNGFVCLAGVTIDSEPHFESGLPFSWYRIPKYLPVAMIVTTAEGLRYNLNVVITSHKGCLLAYTLISPDATKPFVFSHLATAKEVDRIESANKLHELFRAALMYAGDHEERYPDTLPQIGSYLRNNQDLRWILENVVYLGKGKDSKEPPYELFAYDKTWLEGGKGKNVLYFDGHVEFESRGELKNLGIESNSKTGVQIEVEKSAGRDEKTVGSDHKQRLQQLVEDFFEHNYRDITSRKTIEWGEPAVDAKGNMSISYKYEMIIWDKDKFLANEIFTFDKDGTFLNVQKVKGFPKSLGSVEVPPQDVSTKESIQKLVEKFFSRNYRDITARKTIEWGEPNRDENGNVSIRYKYEATIWGKDKIISDEVFTFDRSGRFVSVKKLAQNKPTEQVEIQHKISELNLNSPESTVITFTKAAARGDVAVAMACVAEDSHDREDIKATLTRSDNPFYKLFKAIDIKKPVQIISKEMQDDVCSIAWKVTFKNGFKGRWLIVGI
jgi:prepilin-type processing-associated H-X9-DG protein